MVFGIGFLFMHIICNYLSLPCLPFFNLFAGVELLILGFLLYYSAKDINRYLVIIIASCVFRYIMAGPAIYTMITVETFQAILIGAVIYDYLSATLTLLLLWKLNLLSLKKKSEIQQ